MKDLEAKLQKTLLWAPRLVKCEWESCKYAEDCFGSYNALLRHVKQHHGSSSVEAPIVCQFKPCKYSGPNGEELSKHVLKQHLSINRCPIGFCGHKETSFLSWIDHLQRKHGISENAHPVTLFSEEPEVPPYKWPALPSRMRVDEYVLPEVASDPECSVEEFEDISELLEKPFDFLEEKPEHNITTRATITGVRSKSRGPIEFDILLATNLKPFDHLGSVPTEFYAELKPPPQDRFIPSNPCPYRTGEPIVPRRPPPLSIGYKAMMEAVLPTLQKSDA
ncbi:hypothetical protein CPB86DRAFT_813990 [Serendipita vermifera]|nr:hypothetical protein CPB86DRAFT_813990 [Serendipita vermifera]